MGRPLWDVMASMQTMASTKQQSCNTAKRTALHLQFWPSPATPSLATSSSSSTCPKQPRFQSQHRQAQLGPTSCARGSSRGRQGRRDAASGPPLPARRLHRRLAARVAATSGATHRRRRCIWLRFRGAGSWQGAAAEATAEAGGRQATWIRREAGREPACCSRCLLSLEPSRQHGAVLLCLAQQEVELRGAEGEGGRVRVCLECAWAGVEEYVEAESKKAGGGKETCSTRMSGERVQPDTRHLLPARPPDMQHRRAHQAPATASVKPNAAASPFFPPHPASCPPSHPPACP